MTAREAHETLCTNGWTMKEDEGWLERWTREDESGTSEMLVWTQDQKKVLFSQVFEGN